MEYSTLEELTKSEDPGVSYKAKKLIEEGFPKHACFEILLKQIIK